MTCAISKGVPAIKAVRADLRPSGQLAWTERRWHSWHCAGPCLPQWRLPASGAVTLMAKEFWARLGATRRSSSCKSQHRVYKS